MGTIETMLAGDMTDVNTADDLLDPRDYNGALWDYFSDQASGTGVFNTYLAIQPPGGEVVERGFNIKPLIITKPIPRQAPYL